MPEPHPVCRVEELPPGQRKIVEINGKSIGVFNIDGNFHAIRNSCPHQLAPLCEGTVSGTTLPGAVGEFNYGHEGCIIRCPWHGWEFDITTGRSVFNPRTTRVRHYKVEVAASDASPGASERTAGDDAQSVPAYPVEVRGQQVMVLV